MLLITGASGFVGRHLLQLISNLSPAGINSAGVLPVFLNSPVEDGISVDLTDTGQVAAVFRKYKISGIIHLAAESRTGVCQNAPEVAHLGNVVSTANLLQGAIGSSLPWFLYVSTDMVFSGNEGHYRETDEVAPVNEYGKSKARAERLVQDYPGKWCIVRPALIYGASLSGRGSSFSWTVDTLKNGNGKFFTDEIRTPVYVNDLTRLLWILSQTRHQGILHAGGLERMSRWDFAQVVAKYCDLPLSEDQTSKLSDDPINAWRPRDLSLISESAQSLIKFTALKQALEDKSNIDVGLRQS